MKINSKKWNGVLQRLYDEAECNPNKPYNDDNAYAVARIIAGVNAAMENGQVEKAQHILQKYIMGFSYSVDTMLELIGLMEMMGLDNESKERAKE